jgi:hypothetical protein
MRIGRKDIPERKAVVVLSFWDFLYLIIPYGFIRYSIGENLYIPKLFIFVFFVLICLVHFFLLIPNKRFLKIYREFENDGRYRKNNKLMLAIFLVLPFIVMVLFTFTIWR